MQFSTTRYIYLHPVFPQAVCSLLLLLLSCHSSWSNSTRPVGCIHCGGIMYLSIAISLIHKNLTVNLNYKWVWLGPQRIASVPRFLCISFRYLYSHRKQTKSLSFSTSVFLTTARPNDIGVLLRTPGSAAFWDLDRTWRECGGAIRRRAAQHGSQTIYGVWCAYSSRGLKTSRSQTPQHFLCRHQGIMGVGRSSQHQQ